ncbi:deoxynucleoside triphosphate triphosphohydrolase SAMHD1-like [Anarhichas minor]|uniref:deoxynucleoside triphosphate triphosphohydrolase SAMHD1-like n=1 Tax=Anarhichas minor TaxID=65739 RepID=UPI003F739FA1
MTTDKSSRDNWVWFYWDTPQFQTLRNIKQLVRNVLFGTCCLEHASTKVFNDPIHGTVELPPLLVKIIDTPQFQRLRYIKQLGGVYYVFPGATHNRFQHSIGVAHLAGEFVKALKTRQPELNINNRDVLCVQIAGLCHDLGHGPFSHSFEKFIHKAHPEKEWKEWTHEKASLDMFDYLVADNKLKPVMKQHRLVLPQDLDFIKELLDYKAGFDEGCCLSSQQWPYKGRPEDKSFLYEIVANKRNGVDVDKFDYLARDAHHLGIQNNFDHLRFIKFARVCEVDGQKQICTRDKEVNNLYELYHLRYTLHRKACQHSVNNIIESMITKAFVEADKHIKIKGSGGKMFTLSTAIKDMKAYTKLTDQVYEQILYSSKPELAKAKDILKKVVDRKHPRFLGERKPTEVRTSVIKMKRCWEKELADCQKDGLKAKDFEVDIVKFDYGMKSEDPIDEMRFYNKRNPDVANRLPEHQKSVFHPKYCSEKLIRVYYKNTDEASVTKAYEHMDTCCLAFPTCISFPHQPLAT